jgi:tetratricopeptide (TPR) repeat protein
MPQRMHRINPRSLATLAACLIFGLGLLGCQSDGPIGTLPDASGAYSRGEYERAYDIASEIADEPSLESDEAAYIAGLSAGELGKEKKAIKYLKQAAEGFDDDLAADAGLMLGLAYAARDEHDKATDALLAAAPKLTGEDRAKAYYYAAIAQQRLGRWARARDNLILAKALSTDVAFRQQIDDQLAIQGYTLQVGSYPDADAAQAAADALAPKAKAAGMGSPTVEANPSRPGRLVVRVGRFSTYRSAETFRDSLETSDDVFVVPLRDETPP